MLGKRKKFIKKVTTHLITYQAVAFVNFVMFFLVTLSYEQQLSTTLLASFSLEISLLQTEITLHNGVKVTTVIGNSTT